MQPKHLLHCVCLFNQRTPFKDTYILKTFEPWRAQLVELAAPVPGFGPHAEDFQHCHINKGTGCQTNVSTSLGNPAK